MEAVLICCSEENTEHEGKSVDLLADLRSYPRLWSGAIYSDCKNKITGASARNKFPQKSVLSLRDQVRNSVIWEEFRLKLLLLQMKTSQLR